MRGEAGNLVSYRNYLLDIYNFALVGLMAPPQIPEGGKIPQTFA